VRQIRTVRPEPFDFAQESLVEGLCRAEARRLRTPQLERVTCLVPRASTSPSPNGGRARCWVGSIARCYNRARACNSFSGCPPWRARGSAPGGRCPTPRRPCHSRPAARLDTSQPSRSLHRPATHAPGRAWPQSQAPPDFFSPKLSCRIWGKFVKNGYHNTCPPPSLRQARRRGRARRNPRSPRR
jgi:hypothetical protein